MGGFRKWQYWKMVSLLTKGQTKSKWFFQADDPSKKQTNEFDFTIKIPQVDLFSFIFWKKLKTPKQHFEINWPLSWLHRLVGQKKSPNSKGQLISECLFGVFNFFQKMNENKSTWGAMVVKSSSFIGRIVGLIKLFRLCLTFKAFVFFRF